MKVTWFRSEALADPVAWPGRTMARCFTIGAKRLRQALIEGRRPVAAKVLIAELERLGDADLERLGYDRRHLREQVQADLSRK